MRLGVDFVVKMRGNDLVENQSGTKQARKILGTSRNEGSLC
jgi:hypothetical protein